LEPLLICNSPVAARSCERMSLHLPGMRHTLQALHLRPRWHLPRRKLGRRQYLGYLEGGVSTSIPLPSTYGSYFVILVLSVMLLTVLCSLLVAVGRPCRCLRRPPSHSSHFSTHHSRPPFGAGTTSVQLSVPNSNSSPVREKRCSSRRN
jgi:hypothetical protein